MLVAAVQELQRMRNQIVTVLIALSVLAAPRPAAAWGFEGHKYILDRAIALLPPEIRPFFEKNRVTIVEHAIDPDLWRNVGFDAQEGPRHQLGSERNRRYQDRARRRQVGKSADTLPPPLRHSPCYP